MVTVDEALDYYERGFAVIPIDPLKKAALCKWKQHQRQRPDQSQIRQWFGDDDQKGIAAICGLVSGGLICRDFDCVERYEEWATNYPSFARTLPTASTPRPGRHVWMKGDPTQVTSHSKTGSTVIDFGDGELRAGGLTLLPPSASTRGEYRWLVPMGHELPIVDLVKAGFLQTLQHSGHREPRRTQRTQDVIVSSALTVLHPTISAAIAQTTPQRSGQRHRCLFALARTLKAIPELADAPIEKLEPICRAWHQAALPAITTKAFDDSWFDLLDAWKNVKFPKGQEPIAMMFRAATENDLPRIALKYETEELRRLVALCRELQRTAGEKPFFLDCRTAAGLLNVDHTRAWRWLRGLVNAGVLKLVQSGGRGKANEYRYLHPLTD